MATNLEAIKRIAISFLHIEPDRIGDFGDLFVTHPFTNTSALFLVKEKKLFNLFEDRIRFKCTSGLAPSIPTLRMYSQASAGPIVCILNLLVGSDSRLTISCAGFEVTKSSIELNLLSISNKILMF